MKIRNAVKNRLSRDINDPHSRYSPTGNATEDLIMIIFSVISLDFIKHSLAPRVGVFRSNSDRSESDIRVHSADPVGDSQEILS